MDARHRRIAARAATLAALTAALGAAAPAGAQPAREAARPTVSISGSETAGGLVAKLIVAYRKAVRRPPEFTITGGGTFAGISDAFRGVTTIGLAARDRVPTDPALLVFTPVAFSAVCIATPTSNPVPGLSRAQFNALAAGTLTDWGAVPGAKATGPIAMVGYAAGEGAQVVVENAFLDPATPRSFPGMVTKQTGPEVRGLLRSGPARIGWLDLAFTKGLHRIPIDGKACTQTAVQRRTYPARRGLNYVTRGRPSGAAAAFIRWTRTSKIARRIVDRDYVPVR
jgi:phosphate transport system substrate-binding protein